MDALFSLEQARTVIHSCHHAAQRTDAAALEENYLTYILSGTLVVHLNGAAVELEAGMVGVLRRHTLVRFRKQLPPDGAPFESISIALHQDRLRDWLRSRQGVATEPYRGNSLLWFAANPVLHRHLLEMNKRASLPGNPTLPAADFDRLVQYLVDLNDTTYNFLFDLSPPHKIDLIDFMGRNFRYNVSLKEFSRLSGRSLSTFKRDFRKYFRETPEKWLLMTRLDTAHELIQQRGLRPTDVAYEVGFRNASHFSTAFSRRYGYTAASLFKQIKGS